MKNLIPSNPSFLRFFQNRIDFLRECNRFGTATNYLRAKTSFEKFLKGKDIKFRHIDTILIDNYQEWLIKKGIIRNSISFHMRILRAVYNSAVKKGITPQNNPFSEAYTGVDKTRKRCVGSEIVKSLVKLSLDHSTTLEMARDMFIFSIYTRGMSFVDMCYLRKTDILEDSLSYIRKKSKSILKIKLEEETLKIINKYIGSHPESPYIFPILRSSSPQDTHATYLRALGLYNHRLKRLAEMIGLNCSLSSYTARHTWASLLYKMEVPVSVISAGLGHTSEKVTRIYLASLDNPVIDDANSHLIKSLS